MRQRTCADRGRSKACQGSLLVDVSDMCTVMLMRVAVFIRGVLAVLPQSSNTGFLTKHSHDQVGD